MKRFRINEDLEPFGADRQIRTVDLILTKSPHFLLRSTPCAISCYLVWISVKSYAFQNCAVLYNSI